MRPRRLALRGFTAFRSPQEVDFTTLDLFAISGPTGSGKSSLLDAMTYALYGKIERVGTEVGQLIAHGSPAMAVELDVDVRDATYRIARRTPRRGSGTATLERVEHGHAVGIASGARDVNAEVRKLIGLDYDAFTRAVLLPQGQFDRFLKGDAATRRRILSDLLDLGLFERMAKRAGEVARDARNDADVRRGVLAREYTSVTAPALEEAQRRAAAARAAERALVAGGPAPESDELGALERTAREAAERSRRAERAASVATAALARAEARYGRASDLAAAQVRALRLAELRAEREDARRTAGDLVGALARAKAVLRSASADVRGARTAADRAHAAVRAARAAADQARHADSIAALSRGLRRGDPCPVCGEPLRAPPRRAAGTLERAIAAASTAERALEAAELELEAAETIHREAESTVHDAASRLAGARAVATAAGERAAVLERELAAILGAKLPRDPHAALTERRAHLDGLERNAREAEREAARAREAAATATTPFESLTTRLAAAHERALREAIRTTAAAEAAADAIARRAEGRRRLEAEARTLDARAALFAELAQSLKADRIVDFLQSEALTHLANAGSEHLAYLSNDRYRLRYRADEFRVVDTWNADEERSVRTLSGGETFLASLALSLALAAQVRELALDERARLDSLFLDEGFGALDHEALETAVEALERLGGDGRLIGVITHITELAERLTPGVAVRPSPDGSALVAVPA